MSLQSFTPPTPGPAGAWAPVDLPGHRLPPASRHDFEFELAMRYAGSRRVRLHVEAVGDPGAPSVWVAGGISASRHVLANRSDASAGWWQTQAGPGLPLNAGALRLLACDWLGADGELDVPIDTADQADAIALALDRLGVRRLRAFVGASYGGMVGQCFAQRHAGRLGRLVCLSAAHRPHPYASAWRALQRQLLDLGTELGDEGRAVALARQFAMLSYRGPQDFAGRFALPAQLQGDRARCASEPYLQHCGQRHAQRWTATACRRLSESIDLHQVDPGLIRTPTTLLAVEGDWLAPPEDIRQFAQGISAPVVLKSLRSPWGHDAFLKERAAIGELLRGALACTAIGGCH